MPREVRPVGFVVLVTLSLLAGTASWAQQKPGSGTTSQNPPPQVCTPQRMAYCQEKATASCAGGDANCISFTTNSCLGAYARP